MSLFPIFVKLHGRLVVVVGGGEIAAGKIDGLLRADAKVRLIAPDVHPSVAEPIHNGKIEWIARKFQPNDLSGATLAIAATSAPGVNAEVYREAEARGILCNAVDDIENCHFYYGSIVHRGDLQIAISTNGKSPALAQRLRQELEQQFGPEYEMWLEWLGAARELLRAADGGTENNKQRLHHLASKPMYERFVKEVSKVPARCGVNGKVHLVGAGPGDPELLTLKAARLLANADVVFYDALVSREVLSMISHDAELIDVGKRAGRKLLTQDEINSLLVSYAKENKIVIRLKGGDPLLFGRAGEEMEALRLAQLDFEIVPGITAAVGAAAGARISLTDRRLASQVLFTTFSRGETGHLSDGGLNWAAITPETTIAIYMPGTHYGEVAERLIENGLSRETPCVVVSQATRAEQQIRWSTIALLGNETQLPAPSLLIVGRVASHAKAQSFENWGGCSRRTALQSDAAHELRFAEAQQN